MDKKIAFLTEHAAGLSHSDAGLISHLQGTRELLARWEAREALRDAGLFHSVYGTESYRQAAVPLDLRPRVQAVIGEEAEAIVFHFGVMNKDSFYANLDRAGDFEIEHRISGERLPLDAQLFDDLCDLTVANWLEQRPRVSEEYRYLKKEEFFKMRPRLLRGARGALDAAYGFGEASG